eukprot:593216_1
MANSEEMSLRPRKRERENGQERADDGNTKEREEVTLEQLQKRLETLKQEKDSLLKDLETQRQLHLRCVENRFEAAKKHLRDQLEADKVDVKRDIIQQLQIKKRQLMDKPRQNSPDDPRAAAVSSNFPRATRVRPVGTVTVN